MSRGAAVGVVVNPCQAADVEAVAGPCDGYVGEPGFTVVDGSGEGLALVVVLVAVRWWGEVVGDSRTWPFAPFGFVCGGDGHLGGAFVVELVDGSEDGAGLDLIVELVGHVSSLPLAQSGEGPLGAPVLDSSSCSPFLSDVMRTGGAERGSR